VPGNGHAPIWNSGGRSDASTDCNRVNLSIRQHGAAVGRRVATRCKGEDGLRQQLVLYQAHYNFVLPHASFRQPMPQPVATNGLAPPRCGSRVHRRWQRD
jgi:hypothetical protein